MKNMDATKKKIIFLVSIIFILLILFSTLFFVYQNLKNKEKYIIVVGKTDDFLNVEFWASVNSGLTMAADEFRVKYEYMSPSNESDVQRQIEIIDEAIALKPDAIVLVAADYEILKPSAQKIIDNNIVLFTMDSDVNLYKDKISFIGTNSYAAGQIAGNLMNEKLLSGDRVIFLNQYDGASTQINREAGAKLILRPEAFAQALNCFDNSIIAKNNTLKFLDKKSEYYDESIKAIYCVNEVVTYGACLAISELGLGDEIYLVGFDTSARLAPYIESGVLDVTIGQKPFNMGYITIETAVKYLNGYSVPTSIDTGVVTINNENMFTKENQKLLFPFTN